MVLYASVASSACRYSVWSWVSRTEAELSGGCPGSADADSPGGGAATASGAIVAAARATATAAAHTGRTRADMSSPPVAGRSFRPHRTGSWHAPG